jgi:hypothetical protein
LKSEQLASKRDDDASVSLVLVRAQPFSVFVCFLEAARAFPEFSNNRQVVELIERCNFFGCGMSWHLVCS